MSSVRTRGLVVVALLLLTSCASTGGVHPSVRMASLESIAGKTDRTTEAVTWPKEQWWKVFRDAQLDALVDAALVDNPTLATAQARLARAQAATAAANAERFPQINGSVDVQRQRLSKNYLYPPPLGGSDITSATGQINGSWELDFFGRERAALAAALSQERAAAAEQQAARIALASSVAQAYVQLARLMDARAVALATRKQRELIVELVRERVASGLDTKAELSQAEV